MTEVTTEVHIKIEFASCNLKVFQLVPDQMDLSPHCSVQPLTLQCPLLSTMSLRSPAANATTPRSLHTFLSFSDSSLRTWSPLWWRCPFTHNPCTSGEEGCG